MDSEIICSQTNLTTDKTSKWHRSNYFLLLLLPVNMVLPLIRIFASSGRMPAIQAHNHRKFNQRSTIPLRPTTRVIRLLRLRVPIEPPRWWWLSWCFCCCCCCCCSCGITSHSQSQSAYQLNTRDRITRIANPKGSRKLMSFDLSCM